MVESFQFSWSEELSCSDEFFFMVLNFQFSWPEERSWSDELRSLSGVRGYSWSLEQLSFIKKGSGFGFNKKAWVWIHNNASN
jgi:hypothetical protein